MVTPVKTHLLLILDGWGIREPAADNAISAANTPHYDALLADYPNMRVHTSGLAVGLPEGQMGNSEVGHMNIGAGRVVYQDFTRISREVESGQFTGNPALVSAIDAAIAANKAVHIVGLLSPGGVHSHEAHLFAAIRMAAERGARRLYLHGVLDGRDMPPQSAQASIDKAEALFVELGVGKIASVIGRYYAMDRDNRWDRVEAAYRLMSEGEGALYASAKDALAAAYADDITDEFVPASVIGRSDEGRVQSGDAFLFMNFRADRARELTRAFTQPDFAEFPRERLDPLHFVALTEYESNMYAEVAYGAEDIHHSLGEQMALAGRKQLRIAETEKYAHVTFFFNGGQEALFEGEDRQLVPSPDVATYDLQPSMNAPVVVEHLVEAIQSQQYDLIVCNLANPDMVGHTGKFPAAVKAVEAIDEALGQLSKAVLSAKGRLLITADHGNIEQMSDPETGQPHTAHTTNPVPLVFVANDAEDWQWQAEEGALCDLAPTLLTLIGDPIPDAMTGKALLASSAG